jgi:hypothetical protein
MYANIFSDVIIDERRMKKRVSNNTSVQELVEEKAEILELESRSIPGTNSKKYSETSTTVIFTSGNNKMKQAMGVKMVADELLAATGTVAGGTLGLFAAVASRKPQSFFKGVATGEKVGRTVGSWMWSAING